MLVVEIVRSLIAARYTLKQGHQVSCSKCILKLFYERPSTRFLNLFNNNCFVCFGIRSTIVSQHWISISKKTVWHLGRYVPSCVDRIGFASPKTISLMHRCDYILMLVCLWGLVLQYTCSTTKTWCRTPKPLMLLPWQVWRTTKHLCG